MRPWGWRDLWRHGGFGAAVVVAASVWLLAVLWFVSNGTPSAGGTPPQIVVADPTPTAVPSDDRGDGPAMGGR